MYIFTKKFSFQWEFLSKSCNVRVVITLLSIEEKRIVKSNYIRSTWWYKRKECFLPFLLFSFSSILNVIRILFVLRTILPMKRILFKIHVIRVLKHIFLKPTNVFFIIPFFIHNKESVNKWKKFRFKKKKRSFIISQSRYPSDLINVRELIDKWKMPEQRNGMKGEKEF